MRTVPSLSGSVVALVAGAACACATPSSALPRPTPLTQAEIVTGPPARARPALRVTVEGVGRGEYNAKALGASGGRVAIRLVNEGNASADVAGLRARFEVTREGVAFPCADVARPTILTHEPSTLEPGDAFVFERELDCALPLPGRYTVRAFLGFARDRQTTSSEPVAMFPFELELEPGTEAPVPFASRRGLRAILTADRVSRPLDAAAWARGDYRVVVAIINGGAERAKVGPGALSFAVRKKGGALFCASESARLELPGELPSGATHVAYAPLACAPRQEGEYEVTGYLSLGGERVAIGRFGLRVTADPIEFVPISMRNLDLSPLLEAESIGRVGR